MIANTLKRLTNSVSCMKHMKSSSMMISTRLGASKTFTVSNRYYSSSSNEQKSNSVDEESHEDFQAKKKVTGIDGNNLTDEKALEMIKKWVTGNKVCLFMKGDPKEPRCGFSNFVVQTLKFYKIKDYKSVDVLKYEVIRKQVKVYSNWPTFPQLYIDGKLIGGSDIVQEMHKDGSLKELLIKANLIE